jgi:hypothetical protein
VADREDSIGAIALDAKPARARGLVELIPAVRHLRAALAAVLVQAEAPELALFHRWLDNWRGVGLLAVGLYRIGYDLDLRQYGDGHWRTSFYATGFAHSILGGSAWEPTPWRAVQRGRGRSRFEVRATSSTRNTRHAMSRQTWLMVGVVALVVLAPFAALLLNYGTVSPCQALTQAILRYSVPRNTSAAGVLGIRLAAEAVVMPMSPRQCGQALSDIDRIPAQMRTR